MEFTRTRRTIKPINVVSLIDIIFTVILFFIIAGHLEKFSIIPIELPRADSGQRLDEGPIVVLLGTLGETIINDELIADAQTAVVLRQEFSVNPERVVTIKADAKMDANRLVDFLNQVRAAGGKNLSLVTDSGPMTLGAP